MLKIKRLQTGEGDFYSKIRLRALKDAPGAFGSDYESSLKRSRDSWEEQADEGSQGPDRAIFIATLNDQPVGMAALYRLDLPRDVGELIQVWVAPEVRRTGVAVALMDTVFDWASQNRFCALVAGIMPGNNGAMKFYQNDGFVPQAGVILNCPGDAAVLMKDVT